MTEFEKMLDGAVNRMIERNIDIVFVFDASKSMECLIKKFQQVESLYDEVLGRALYHHIKSVNCVRFKVIWYRDFLDEGDKLYGESRFFMMPDESEHFKDFLLDIQPQGVCGDSRPGIAALDRALMSDFVQKGDIKRHVVVLFTDMTSRACEDGNILNEKQNADDYASICKKWDDVSDSLDVFWRNGGEPLDANLTEKSELTKYTKLDKRGKRLILVAPDDCPWNKMDIELEDTLRIEITGICGPNEVNLESIFEIISYAIY